MENSLKTIIRQIAELDADFDIHSSSNLANDLGIDSLRRMDLVIDIEDKFDVRISDQEFAKVVTFQDLIDITNQHNKKA